MLNKIDSKYQYYRYYVTLSNNIKIWTVSNVKPLNLNSNDIYGLNKKHKKAEIDKNKTPILMLHGYLGSSGFWIKNLDDITETKHILYAIDLPGFGKSTRIDYGKDPYTYKNMIISTIENYIRCIDLKRFILIGIFKYLSIYFNFKISIVMFKIFI